MYIEIENCHITSSFLIKTKGSKSCRQGHCCRLQHKNGLKWLHVSCCDIWHQRKIHCTESHRQIPLIHTTQETHKIHQDDYMEIYIEIMIEIFRQTTYGWNLYTTLVKVHIFFMHRRRHLLPGTLFSFL